LIGRSNERIFSGFRETLEVLVPKQVVLDNEGDDGLSSKFFDAFLWKIEKSTICFYYISTFLLSSNF